MFYNYKTPLKKHSPEVISHAALMNVLPFNSYFHNFGGFWFVKRFEPFLYDNFINLRVYSKL